MNKPASLSIVIPCHNEQEVLSSTYNTLKELVENFKKRSLINNYELVFVNNGSTDETMKVMQGFFDKDKQVVVIDLRKNFGVQGSFTAGLFSARNEMIITIDADLQDDPAKIEDMIKKYYEGYDMVLGVRENRDADSFLKRFTAQTFYKFLNALGVKTVYNHADFRLLSNTIVAELKKFPERVRFLRGLIFEVESKYAIVYYKRKKRKLGKSKFNPLSLLSFAFDGITSFSSVPIRLVTFFGIIMFLLSFVGLGYVLYSKFILLRNVPGWASLAITVLFFGGIQNLFLGIIGEYIAKIYLETKGRPVFIIRRELRHN